jgi:hypothetical protein
MHQPAAGRLAMARSDRVRLKDLRAAYRLIGECRELGSDPEAWRLHMLNGLRQMTGAQVALYLHICDLGSDTEHLAEPLDAGFLDASQRALWAHYQREKAYRDDLFHQRYYADFNGSLRTRSLESVVEMPRWRLSRHYNEYVRACGLDDRITSSLRLSADPSSPIQVIVLHRSAAEGSYSRRSVRMVRLFHDELRSLIGRQLTLPGPATGAWQLPLQLQHVLRGLLEGDAEKQIAGSLGISRHTVNRHVQRLYRRFGVHSRGELMFRCHHMLRLLRAKEETPE